MTSPHAFQKPIKVLRADTFGEYVDLQLRIDIQSHVCQHVHLRSTHLTQAGPGLAVEVGQFEGIQVGDVESADTKPGQGEQMTAAYAAETGNGNALASQQGLFGFRNPANVTGKGSMIIEGWLHD